MSGNHLPSLANIIIRRGWIIALALFIMPLVAFSQGKIPAIVEGDEVSYLQGEGKVVAKGNVSLKYKDLELYCDEVVYDVNLNIAHTKGDTKAIRGKTILYGKDVVYDLNTYNAQFTDVRVEDSPIYGEAKTGKKIGKEKVILNKGYITTCDRRAPHYRVTATKIFVYPGEKVVAKNVVFKVGPVPMFYLPFFSQSLKDDAFPGEIYPGKDKDWGPYLLTRWRYSLDEENKGKIIFDWYENRDLAGGIVHKLKTERLGEALMGYYRLDDKMYDREKRSSLFDMYPDREDIDSKRLEDDRYKAQFSYSWQPIPRLSVKAEYNKFSDEYFLKDFFERQYEIEPNTSTYTLINYALSNSSLSLRFQKRANRFFSKTEYLPQLEYDFYRQELDLDKFYFQSDSSLGNLHKETAYSTEREDAFRIYSHNVLSYVDKIKWININPYVGSYATFYSQNQFGDSNIWRGCYESGISANVKFYRPFNAGWNIFGEKINKIRHIVTPQATYEYIHDPTVPSGNLYQFDSEDSLGRSESIVFTLGNKLQAKSKEKTWDFLYFAPSLTYIIDQEVKGSYFDDLTADLEIYPIEEFSLSGEATYVIDKYDSNTRRISEVEADCTIRGWSNLESSKDDDNEKYRFSLGHRYRRHNSTQGTLDFSCQLTSKLKYKTYLRYEHNTGDLDEMDHSISADLHCWWMDFGINAKKHQRGGKDFTFWVEFKLKAFPNINIGFDREYKGAKKHY